MKNYVIDIFCNNRIVSIDIDNSIPDGVVNVFLGGKPMDSFPYKYIYNYNFQTDSFTPCIKCNADTFEGVRDYILYECS